MPSPQKQQEMNAEVAVLAHKLRSAAKTGRRLHLDPGQVAVLLHEDIYSVISRLEADAMRKQCALATANDNKFGPIISGNAPELEPGTSAGSNAHVTDELSRGARQRALAEVKLATRRAKPLTR